MSTSQVAAAEPVPSNSQREPDRVAGSEKPFSDAQQAAQSSILTAEDNQFLDDLQRRGIQFFIDEADPVTGLMPDRARASGGVSNGVASIASVGFGLTALCIGEERGWVTHQEAYDRSLRVLRFLRDKAPQERGHFYHFLDMKTGARQWNCEVSNIDTALLMAGVLTVRQHFPDTELAKLANELFERVEWPWLLQPDGTLSMGWKPEAAEDVQRNADADVPHKGGFLSARWNAFNEGPLIYLLAMGSRTHPLSPDAWAKWRREPVMTYAGLTYVQCPPLFTHQYPHCWFDMRGQNDGGLDYFRNSQLATIAQRQWTIDVLAKRFPTYGPNMWGLTASDFDGGYTAWGGPSPNGEVEPAIDGSVVPCAPGGSLAFEPRICLDALKEMKQKYGEKAYLKYGFVDAFNPRTGWYNQDVLGIDVGATVLMAENCRSGFVWKTFMSSPEAIAGMKAAGFRPNATRELKNTSLIDSAAPRGK